MAVGTVLSRLTGLGRIAAMTFALGVVESRLADTYNIANTIPNVLYELVLGGVLTSVFIPVLVEQMRKAESHDEAETGVSALVYTVLLVLAIVSLVACLAAPLVMRLFTFRVAGPEQQTQQELATFFFRFFAFQIVLYGYSAIADGLLNAHNRFAVPMFAPIVNNVVVIVTFVAYGWIYSGKPTDWAGMWLLALGTTAGIGAMAAVHWPFVRRLPTKLRRKIDFAHPGVKKLARLSTWTFGYVATNQAGFFVSLILANGVQGGPTAYFVAFAFFQLPYGVVAVSIMTALVPTLARQAIDGDWEAFALRTARGLRATAVILFPVTAAVVVLALPGIELLLQHGVMSRSSSELVARVLQMFAIGIVPFSAWLLFLRAFYAMQDAKTPFYLNLFEVGATVILDFPFFYWWKIPGLALAHTSGYILGSVAAGLVLSRRVGGLEWAKTWWALGRIAVAAIAAAGGMVGASLWAGHNPLLQVLLGSLVGGVVFLGFAAALRVDLSVYRRMFQ